MRCTICKMKHAWKQRQGGPAYKVHVAVENITSHANGSMEWGLFDADKEKDGVSQTAFNGDKLEIVIKYKDIIDQEYESRETREALGT